MPAGTVAEPAGSRAVPGTEPGPVLPGPVPQPVQLLPDLLPLEQPELPGPERLPVLPEPVPQPVQLLSDLLPPEQPDLLSGLPHRQQPGPRHRDP